MPEGAAGAVGRLLWAGAAVLLAACGGPGLAPADSVARVAGENIPYAEFEDYVSTRVGLDTTSSSVVLSGLLDQFLDEHLLRALAVDRGLAAVETPGWQVVDELLASSEPVRASSAEVAAYYQAHRDRFSRPERAVLRQVLAEDQATAEAIAELLGEGVDFDDLAARYLSEGVSASEGEITREDLPAAFVEIIFALEVGEVSEVVTADYGFHVFQVVASLPAEEWSLAEATPDIVEALGVQDRRRTLDRLGAEASDRYNPRVHARNQPFNNEGRYEEKD